MAAHRPLRVLVVVPEVKAISAQCRRVRGQGFRQRFVGQQFSRMGPNDLPDQPDDGDVGAQIRRGRSSGRTRSVDKGRPSAGR